MPGPKPSGNIRVNVLMSKTLKKKVETSAQRRGVSFSQWMREATSLMLQHELEERRGR